MGNSKYNLDYRESDKKEEKKDNPCISQEQHPTQTLFGNINASATAVDNSNSSDRANNSAVAQNESNATDDPNNSAVALGNENTASDDPNNSAVGQHGNASRDPNQSQVDQEIER